MRPRVVAPSLAQSSLQREARAQARLERLEARVIELDTQLHAVQAQLYGQATARPQQPQQLRQEQWLPQPRVAPVITGEGDAVRVQTGEQARLAQPPARQSSAFRNGVQAFARGEMAQAERAFEDFLQAFPGHADASKARFWSARCALERGAPHRAQAGLQKFLSAYPNDPQVPDALLRLALTHEQLGDAQQAKRLFCDLARRHPHTASAEVGRARCGTGMRQKRAL